MRSEDFMERLDHRRIVDAIAAAEKKTSGEVRVFVQRGELAGDPLPFAEKKFLELGMEKTAERNAVLILVAPRAQKCAVVGDEGIHSRCGQEFWQLLVGTMRGHFQREEFTGAIVEAIVSTGDLLAQYFPRQCDDRNELCDDVVEG
ncbi:TPM domain-containing protein [soil metagenome]